MESQFLLGLVSGLALMFVIVGGLSVFKVEEGHLAVLSDFGRVLTANQTTNDSHNVLTFGPGIHFKKPWYRVRSLSTMERILDLSGADGGISALAADGTRLRIDSKLRYQVRNQNNQVYSYLFSLRRPMEHMKGLFTCLLRNEIANFKGDRAGDDFQPTAYGVIRSERRLLNQKIKYFCDSQIDGKYGLQFNSVDLTDICPPDELAESLNAVFNAQLEAEALFSRAEGECRQQVIAAEKNVDIARASAEATMIDIVESGKHLASLRREGTLNDYVERRKNEVESESRTVFMRS